MSEASLARSTIFAAVLFAVSIGIGVVVVARDPGIGGRGRDPLCRAGDRRSPLRPPGGPCGGETLPEQPGRLSPPLPRGSLSRGGGHDADPLGQRPLDRRVDGARAAAAGGDALHCGGARPPWHLRDPPPSSSREASVSSSGGSSSPNGTARPMPPRKPCLLPGSFSG